MSIGDIIYTFFIGPLGLFFEVVFAIANRHVSNPAYAIILLSLAMNFLVLPLYRRADALQAEERDRENALAPWVRHIKKTFKGDERFMMLQAFYRENNYKPTDSLKGSISLLLEIPFFIAAYHFLSNLQTLRGVAFGPIADLGAPDALIHLGSVTLNLLPILMTLINVISAAIYMKGFPLKSKVQMYGIAAIFLVFLYKSPAGLVFYWTLNNIFSLIKNIFYKLKNPARVLRYLASATGAVLLIIVLFIHPMSTMRVQIIVVTALLLLQLPLLIHLMQKHQGFNITISSSVKSDPLFYCSCLLLMILTGLLIPSAVISASTAEFIDVVNYTSPLWYIVHSAAIAAGTFILWFTIFYKLASKPGRQIFSLFMAIAAVSGLVDYMFFGKSFGDFNSDLVYFALPAIGFKYMLFNLAVICVIAITVIVVWKYRRNLLSFALAVFCIAIVVMSGINCIGINQAIKANQKIINAASAAPQIALNKDGKNVVLLMMDRQIGYYVPYLLNENPELKKQFAGFTFYPNTVSLGNATNGGSPSLYGGYDYAPEEMNRRDKMSLCDKQNEALRVLPSLFSNAGYDVTISDPTYAGYSWIPDLSIFDDIPNCNTYITNGAFELPEYGYTRASSNAVTSRKRNFFCYSLFRVVPAFLQPTLYNNGVYNMAGDASQVMTSLTEAHGMNDGFMRSYSVLCNLPNITTIKNGSTNTFLMMSNDTTHEPMLLSEPSYTPSKEVDNSSYEDDPITRVDDNGSSLKLETEMQVMHYHINMAAMARLGEWFDYLRENDVFDNTRIIIVSDHGQSLFKDVISYTSELTGKEEVLDTKAYNCTLLVKDFNSKDFTIDNTFGTNADTPAYATENLISEPRNPNTGNLITRYTNQMPHKPVTMIFTNEYDIYTNNGNKFLPADWFSVHDDIDNLSNWQYLGSK